MGTLMIELLIGLETFPILFQVLRIPTSFNLLLGRPWIHRAEALPSSLHQKVKFIHDRQVLQISHSEDDLFFTRFTFDEVQTLEVGDFCRDLVAMSFDQHSSTVVLDMIRGMSFMPGLGLGRRQHGPMEFVATVDHDTPFGLGFVPTEADYRYMARLHQEKIRARLTCTPFDYPIRPYRMSLENYFVRGSKAHPHMGDFDTATNIEGVDELQRQFHHLQLGDETSGAPVSVMIAPSSPDRASFSSLCFPEETTDHGADIEPSGVTDGVVPQDEYRDEMDMSMSQIAEVVQPEFASPFDLFGVSAIEVAEETQTVLAPELMEDVIVGDDEFEDTFGFIEGASDFVDPPLSFDILSGFISRSDDVYDSISMDLSIFEYLPVSCDSIYISAPYSHIP